MKKTISTGANAMWNSLKLALWRTLGMPRPDKGWQAPRTEATSSPPVIPPVEQEEETDVLPKSWLLEAMTVEQVESEHMRDGMSFGRQHHRWLDLKAALQDGDTIWSFSSPDESWARLAGRAGIAVVRNDRVVRSIVTIMT